MYKILISFIFIADLRKINCHEINASTVKSDRLLAANTSLTSVLRCGDTAAQMLRPWRGSWIGKE
jgi:hypothetical protein